MRQQAPRRASLQASSSLKTLNPTTLHGPAGAKEGAAALAWHPRRNCMASLGDSGAVFLWARTYSERWSAFAPGFSELQDNEARRSLGHSHIMQ